MLSCQEFMRNLSAFPVSFSYDGKPFCGLGAGFGTLSRRTEDAPHGTQTTVTLRHEASRALFRLEVREYPDYHAWDYTLFITNDGKAVTGTFADLNAVDITVEGADPVIKGIRGDCGKEMYSPYAEHLTDGSRFFRECTSGRPTHHVFPYFKLEYGSGGSFLCIGWPGCWKAEAVAAGSTVRFTGGQRQLATHLAPGESIRTPLIAFLYYETRDDIRNANLWRRWFIDCNMRKVNGKNMPPMFIDWTMSEGVTTAQLLPRLRAYADHGVPPDCYWMDAGWYTDAEGNTVKWPKTGTLQIDESRFPDRFADISAVMAQTGGKLLLWFEPEVIRQDRETFLANMPDFDAAWMLGTAAEGTWLEGQLADLGDPDCRAWLLGRICRILKEADIAVYRQDFNVDPAPVWQQHDSTGRVGYCENRYVTGYLALWDGIIERFPHIWIDACASGGGRNDLETMRRGVPLQISDYWDEGYVNPKYDGYAERQATMLTVMQWFPYIKFWMFGDDSVGDFTYRARSCYTQVFPLAVDALDPAADWALVRRLVAEWRMVSSFCYDDFYPLTPWNNAEDVFRAYEYYSPQKGRGAALAFRPAACGDSAMRLTLMGLDTQAVYRVADTDGGFAVTASGAQLMQNGIALLLPKKRSAAVLTIEKQ